MKRQHEESYFTSNSGSLDLTDYRMRNVLLVLKKFLTKKDIRNLVSVSKGLWIAFRAIYFHTQMYVIEQNILDDPFFIRIAPYVRCVFIGKSMQAGHVAKLSWLAKNIYEMVFNDYFNQYIHHTILPQNLVNLTFGMSFNQDISGQLPQTVQYLKLGVFFDQDLSSDVLPLGLRYLIFKGGYEKFKGMFPHNLKHLWLGWRSDQKLTGVLPQSLEFLTIVRTLSKNKEYFKECEDEAKRVGAKFISY